MNAKRAVTVAGAHGKTTTSSMLAHIRERRRRRTRRSELYCHRRFHPRQRRCHFGRRPCRQGQRAGGKADESDGSFAKYHPQIAIITNSEADHLDHYGTQDNYRAAFVDHAGHATKAVIMCGDDEGNLAVLRALDATVAGRTIVYSTRNAAELGDLNGATLVRIESESETAEKRSRTFHAAYSGRTDRRRGAPHRSDAYRSRHPQRTQRLRGDYRGRAVGHGRRTCLRGGHLVPRCRTPLRVRGTVSQVTVVDDYAHHPTEIAALLDAADRYPQSRSV